MIEADRTFFRMSVRFPLILDMWTQMAGDGQVDEASALGREICGSEPITMPPKFPTRLLLVGCEPLPTE